MQQGLKRSSALDGLCCWSYAHDTRGRMRTGKGVSLVGSHAHRDGWMQPTALCAHKIGAILESGISPTAFPIYVCAAAEAQAVRRQLSASLPQ